jgi:hypothetical protein
MQNGEDRQQQTKARFLKLLSNPLNYRRQDVEAEQPKQLSDEDKIAFRLAGWAQKRECEDTFLPLLDALIDEADNSISASVSDHALAAYATGRRDGLRDLRRRFNQWAGTDVDSVSA